MFNLLIHMPIKKTFIAAIVNKDITLLHLFYENALILLFIAGTNMQFNIHEEFVKFTEWNFIF